MYKTIIYFKENIPLITIRPTTIEDLKNVQSLWADGDVMQFVGYPDGLQYTYKSILQWLARLDTVRPLENHFCIYNDGKFCGETSYGIDKQSNSAWLDIKLFSHARGRGIATHAITHAIQHAFANGALTVWVDPNPNNTKAIVLYKRLGFVQKPMPQHVIALGEDPKTNIYFELNKK